MHVPEPALLTVDPQVQKAFPEDFTNRGKKPGKRKRFRQFQLAFMAECPEPPEIIY